MEFPINRCADSSEGYARKEDNKPGVEPIELLSLVEDDLKCGQPHRDEAETSPVDRELACFLFDLFHVRRVLEDDPGEEDAENTYGDVDVKDPAPGIVVGDPPSGRRPENGRNEDPDCIERDRHTALLR